MFAEVLFMMTKILDNLNVPSLGRGNGYFNLSKSTLCNTMY